MVCYTLSVTYNTPRTGASAEYGCTGLTKMVFTRVRHGMYVLFIFQYLFIVVL